MDISEKIQELQENIQKLQILKSVGADRLVIAQEKEVYRIQQEILEIDRNQPVDIVDAILPKKCRFCTEKITQDERLDCFEENGETCKRKPPSITNLFSLKVMRFVIMASLLLLSLFTEGRNGVHISGSHYLLTQAGQALAFIPGYRGDRATSGSPRFIQPYGATRPCFARAALCCWS